MVPRHVVPLDHVVGVIARAKETFGIEGVTYLGGEPTLQQALPELTCAIKSLGLGVLAFTGRKLEEVEDVLAGCDMVVDGPYVASQHSDARRIIGSANQRIIHLTDRYRGREDWFDSGGVLTGEFNVSGDELVFNGSTI